MTLRGWERLGFRLRSFSSISASATGAWNWRQPQNCRRFLCAAGAEEERELTAKAGRREGRITQRPKEQRRRADRARLGRRTGHAVCLCTAILQFARMLRRFLWMNRHAKRLECVQLAGAVIRRGAVRKREQAPRTPNASHSSVAAPLRCPFALNPHWLQLSGPGGSAETGQQEKGDQCPGDDQAQHARAAVLVEHHAEEAQDKAERRRQNDSQPAKGCDGRASPWMQQQHGRQRDQGGERDVQADAAQSGLSFRGGLRLDYRRFFHIHTLRAGRPRACWPLAAA